MIEVDPARDMKKRKVEGDGHHCWTDDEITRYRAHHQSGTKARLAFELFLWTGARVVMSFDLAVRISTKDR